MSEASSRPEPTPQNKIRIPELQYVPETASETIDVPGMVLGGIQKGITRLRREYHEQAHGLHNRVAEAVEEHVDVTQNAAEQLLIPGRNAVGDKRETDKQVVQDYHHEKRPDNYLQRRRVKKLDKKLRKNMRGAVENFSYHKVYDMPELKDNPAKGVVARPEIKMGTPEQQEYTARERLGYQERKQARRAARRYTANNDKITSRVEAVESVAAGTDRKSTLAKSGVELIREKAKKHAEKVGALGGTVPSTERPGQKTPAQPETSLTTDESSEPQELRHDTIVKFGDPERDTKHAQTRTEKALELILKTLSTPDSEGKLIQSVGTDLLNRTLSGIEGFSPALAKFTLKRLQNEGFVDANGKVVDVPERMKLFLATKLNETASTRPYEGAPKDAAANRLEEIKDKDDKVYAFALGHIGGFYSEKNGFKALPRLSLDSLKNALARGLKSYQDGKETVEITEQDAELAYNRLIEQGIISPDGTVRQSQQTIRGTMSSVYRDDIYRDHPEHPGSLDPNGKLTYEEVEEIKKSGGKPRREQKRRRREE